ncbi:hypothetical protein V2J09_020634 [Rumex salicifolius]
MKINPSYTHVSFIFSSSKSPTKKTPQETPPLQSLHLPKNLHLSIAEILALKFLVKLKFFFVPIMWDSETESVSGRDYANDALSTSNQGLKTDGFEQRGHNWFVASDIPSDLLVQIGDTNFHLHKYPLISRSGKLNRLIYESVSNEEVNKIILDDLPGGSEAFELASKFCYGIAVDLTASNISGLRCAAEFLEMTEDLEEGNLIFKTEAFLSYVVLSSWRDSIVVLKSCERLSPWAENLQIVRRCSESIAWKACANPKGIRWAYTGRPTSRISSPSRWNDQQQLIIPNNSNSNPNSPSPSRMVPPDWWFEDVSFLRIDHFVRVITAIKVKGMRFELIGASIMHYASKWLPGLITKEQSMMEETSWKGGGLHMVVSDGQDSTSSKDRRMIIESLISILPPQKDSLSCSFLLRLLRMANMLKVAPALVTELEKRVGMQFEQASLGDLLIPCFHSSGKGENTMYDVDLVQRLLEHFLVQEQTVEQCLSPSGRMQLPEKLGLQEGRLGSGTAKARVARLVDSYLTEVARDRSLSLTKFQVLAEALPEFARSCDDGLYRAIDSYLKLSIDACMHAAQNERLPLRVVVQVLFSEQVKISNALANNTIKAAESSGGDPHHNNNNYQPMIPNRKTLLEGTPQSFQEGWATAKKDINTLKFELESVKTKYIELQNEMEAMQRQFEKMGKQSGGGGGGGKQSAWSSGWKKLSKFTKMGNLEGHEMVGGAQIPQAEMSRKAPRRWRNSIS